MYYTFIFFNKKTNNLFEISFLFKMDSKMQKRVIFEHSIKASMTCKYNETAEAIVFDHLSPPESDRA
jgi:hypothetical protein